MPTDNGADTRTRAEIKQRSTPGDEQQRFTLVFGQRGERGSELRRQAGGRLPVTSPRPECPTGPPRTREKDEKSPISRDFLLGTSV